MMRVVSLVPSWTETLIDAGVEVVGRTRYCIHPQDKVQSIPAVGGTKKVDWEKIAELKPDLVIFDREENTKEMSSECPLPWHATHVRSINDMPGELKGLADVLQVPALDEFAARWRKVVESPAGSFNRNQPPAFLEWTKHTEANGPVIYVIWQEPWMAVGPETFIGSVFSWFGCTLWGDKRKYPEFDPSKLPQDCLFLCSSEPYPFVKRQDLLSELPGAVALVDGEKLGWFGVRSLNFLESHQSSGGQFS